MYGKDNPNCVLSLEQAKRAKYGNEPVGDLVKELGVSKDTIYKIRKGKAWKYV